MEVNELHLVRPVGLVHFVLEPQMFHVFLRCVLQRQGGPL